MTAANKNVDIQTALSKTKIEMMTKPDNVFFSTLCCSLQTKITKDIPTLGVDGISLYVNPDFFLGLNKEERLFLLLHETLHVAYLHTVRHVGKNLKTWQLAIDYVVNGELIKRGYKMPIGKNEGLYDSRFNGMSAEEVYKILLEENQEIECPMPDLIPNPDGSSNTPTEEVMAKMEQEVMSKITQAAMLAEMSNQAGSIPEFIQRMLKDISKPKVNWKVVLSRFFKSLTTSDYSWQRPNKKYLPLYIPKLRSTQLGRIGFAIDTSGSIDEEQFNQFISEVYAVLRMLKPSSIGVYQFDHALQGNAVVKSLKGLLKLPFSGGGGTNPEVAIQEFIKNDAMALIMLTDGYFNKHRLTNPKRPVVWVIYNNESFIPPFGKAIHITL